VKRRCPQPGPLKPEEKNHQDKQTETEREAAAVTAGVQTGI
jgi:hypothetical protein